MAAPASTWSSQGCAIVGELLREFGLALVEVGLSLIECLSERVQGFLARTICVTRNTQLRAGFQEAIFPRGQVRGLGIQCRLCGRNVAGSGCRGFVLCN